MKLICLTIISCCLSISVIAQDTSVVVTAPAVHTKAMRAATGDVYKLKTSVDLPVTLVLDAAALYGMSVIYGRDQVSEAEINALDYRDINSFDQKAWDNFDENAKSLSDMFFYGSMPLPALLFLDKEIRKDALPVTVMYLQALGATGVSYAGTAMIADRYRPYAYNPSVPMEYRRKPGNKNSFLGGHAALVATSTFFVAKVWGDYHPDSKAKWLLYTAAAAAAGTTGYLRIKAGEHFPSDVIVGLAVGTLSGILVPQFHKIKDPKWTFAPYYSQGASGATAVLRIGK